MLKEILAEIFERDLNKLKSEISAYKDDESLWIVKNEITNSAGNLCLHLLGNLNHFVGAILSENGYKRNRDSEFTTKNVSREELANEIEKTIDVVIRGINELSEDDFNKDYPLEKHGKTQTTAYMFLHLLTHFNYHLGQINYHRRLLQNG